MHQAIRIGLCVLGLFFTSFCSWFFLVPDEGLAATILLGCVAASVIFFITKNKKVESEIDNTTVILLYILSFFIPLAGFIVGAIYASKDEEHYKHVGKNCLIFSVTNIILGFIMLAIILDIPL